MQPAELAKAPIDVDRGVTMRQIVAFDKANPKRFEPDIKYGGMTVYMYKSEPGVYYDVHGNTIPEGIAKLAGFETDKLSKMRRKRLAVEAFKEQVSRQLNMEEDEETVILQTAGDWQVISLPNKRAKIVDKETGQIITPIPLPEKDALSLLKELADTAADLAVAEATPATPTGKGK